jgi:hypothetical protein
MNYKLLLGFLLIYQLSFGQNIHDLLIGINYPNSFSGERLAREIGFEAGYHYSRYLNEKFSIGCGIRINMYSKPDWNKNTSLDFYIPVNFGYTINDFTFSGGPSFNAAQFLTFTTYAGEDPEIEGPIQRSPYLDLNTKRTYGLGLNATIEYRLTKRFLIYADYKTVCLKDKYSDNTRYRYGLTTLGFIIRLNNITRDN